MAQFCISKENLNKLFYTELGEERVNLILKNFSDKYSLSDIISMMNDENNEIGKFCKQQNDKFAVKTENVEIVHSIDLAELYFPNENPDICFNIKNSVQESEILTIKDLIQDIDPDTEIDCLIKNGSKQFKFQLKEYPEEYLELTPTKIIEFIDKKIISPEKYNTENNKDLIIVITLKPEVDTAFKELSDFKIIHEYLKQRDIKLLEINFLYNRNCEHLVWYQVYPQLGHSKIPWADLPYHKTKKISVI